MLVFSFVLLSPLPMQLHTSKDFLVKGKRLGGTMDCCAVHWGWGKGPKKPKHVCIKGRDFSSPFFTLDMMW